MAKLAWRVGNVFAEFRIDGSRSGVAGQGGFKMRRSRLRVFVGFLVAGGLYGSAVAEELSGPNEIMRELVMGQGNLIAGQSHLVAGQAHLQRVMELLNPAPEPAVEVIPWFDLGAVGAPNIEGMIKGLRAWDPHCQRAVVTIGAKYIAHEFVLFQDAVGDPRLGVGDPAVAGRGVQVIPGLTTACVMSGKWESPAAWEHLAWWIWRAHEQLPDRPILLDNESALRAYIKDGVPMDLEKFAAGLKMLPAEVEYWWYPSAGGGGKPGTAGAEKLERYMALAAWVESSLDKVVFVDHVSLYSRSTAPRPSTLYAAARLAEVVEKTIPVCYPAYWGYENLPEALRLVEWRFDKSPVLLFPGRGNWESSAARYAQRKAE